MNCERSRKKRRHKTQTASASPTRIEPVNSVEQSKPQRPSSAVCTKHENYASMAASNMTVLPCPKDTIRSVLRCGKKTQTEPWLAMRCTPEILITRCKPGLGNPNLEK